MKKVLIIIAGIVIMLAGNKNKSDETLTIPDDSIRLRIISNSNSELDIKRKMDLKDYIEGYLFEITEDCSSKSEVQNKIINNMDNINDKIATFLNSREFKADFGQNYFPKKIYKGVVYNEGMYDSLVITLGNGKGNNWWCVLFPPLCLLEENTNTTDVEYQLFVSRILNNNK